MSHHQRGGAFSSDIFVGNRKGFYGLGQYTDPWTQRKAMEAKRVLPTLAPMGQTPPAEPSPAEPPAPAKMPVGLMVGWSVVLLASVGIFYAVSSGAPAKPVRANPGGRRRSSRRRSPKPLKYATFVKDRGSRRWREKSRHKTMGAAERAAIKLFDSGKYAAVGADEAPRGLLPNPRRRSSRRRSKRSRRRTSRRRVSKNRKYKGLKKATRRRMPSSSFVFPDRGDGAWPIKGPPGSSRDRDRWQAKQAIKYLHMGRVASRSDFLQIRNAIINEYGQRFWRESNGPSWPKVDKAKKKGMRARRRSSRGKKMAANSQMINKVIHYGYSKHHRSWWVEAPSTHVRFYPSKKKAMRVVDSLTSRYGMRRRRSDKRMDKMVAWAKRATGE